MKYSSTRQNQLSKITKELVSQLNSSLTERQAVMLREVLRYHDWRYYVLAEPTIKDYDYDHLFKWLKQIEEDNPKWKTSDSPTQRVAQVLTKDLPSVEHLVPMLSLDNSYNIEDLQDFADRMSKMV